MNLQAFCSEYLCCPSCHNPLTDEGRCTGCGTLFRNTLGILDLRWPQASSTEDNIVSEIINQYETTSFEDLVHIRYQNAKVPKELLTIYQDYQTNLQERSRQMMDMFQHRLSNYYTVPTEFLALDIGCGVGTSSATLAQRFKWVVSLDPSLPDLLLARKFFDEKKVDNVILVQAYAQNIPLPDNCVAYAVAQNVIEHLFEIRSVFDELHRILQYNGCFCGDSRNRFDLFFPEPHVRLRWVGFFPRKLQPWYVRKFRNVPYTGVFLLSFFELHRHARQAFGGSTQILFPLSSTYGYSLKWDKLIGVIERIPIVRTMILLISPSHILLAQLN